MVAIVVLLDLCFRARTIAASMVIDRPEAIDGAPEGARQQRSNFLVSRGMTAQPAGEESCDAAVAP
jgi:hypothetical protein